MDDDTDSGDEGGGGQGGVAGGGREPPPIVYLPADPRQVRCRHCSTRAGVRGEAFRHRGADNFGGSTSGWCGTTAKNF